MFDSLCKPRSFGGIKEDKKSEETWFLHEVSIIPVKLLVPVLVIAKSVLVASVKSVSVTLFELVNHTIFFHTGTALKSVRRLVLMQVHMALLLQPNISPKN